MGGIVSVYQGAMGRITLFDASVSVAEHAHPQLHVMIKLGGADSLYEIGGRPCALTDRQMVLINAWTPHGNRRGGDHPGTLVMALYLEPAWLRALLDRPVAAAQPFAQPLAPVTPRSRALAHEIADMLAAPAALAEPALDARVGGLLREVLAGFEAAAGAPRAVPRPFDYRIRRAISLLDAEGGRRGSLQRLPKSVGLSRSRFYERFRDSTGLSPGLYADGLVLDRAVRALVETRKPIGQIAEELGFSAQSHFTRFFKAKVCFTPSEYRHVALCEPARH